MTSRTPALFGVPDARDELRVQAEAYVARATVMLTRARALVTDDRVQAIDLLTSRRTDLGRHFQRYQQFKHGSIFDPVVLHGPASSKVVARTMKLDCIALGGTFTAYHARWLDLCAPDWPSYRRDMLATTTMLIQHLDAELRAIRQLLMLSDYYSS